MYNSRASHCQILRDEWEVLGGHQILGQKDLWELTHRAVIRSMPLLESG